MRTYSRVQQPNNTYFWLTVETDANGFDSYVWLATLCQCLQLNNYESPFYANWGIPSQQSVLNQTYPDLSVTLTQQQFKQYFANLTIASAPNPPRNSNGTSNPTYIVNVTLLDGTKTQVTVGI